MATQLSEEILEQFPFEHGKFCGRGKKHWQRKADELVVESLVRAAECDDRSLIGALAKARLLELARQESSEIYNDVLEHRDRCRENLGEILSDILA